tara:strand:+ start:2508 stop:3056 length:549 start_codon:yes stop_codon:yes gene_type:complete
MESNINKKRGLILVGHGGIPSDCPTELTQKFMALHKKRQSQGLSATQLEVELESKIRSWPRTPETDPYKAGLESLAAYLGVLLSDWSLKTAYNEFCAPSISEATEQLISEGSKEIVLITTMVTPGGSHSEKEIPEEVAKLNDEFPEISISYAWPFDLNKVAELLASHVTKFSSPALLTTEDI